MKIYTKRGDAGQTDLLGAGRVDKCHVRVEAYGAVDETQAALSLAVVAASLNACLHPLQQQWLPIQNALFMLGSELAAPGLEDRMPIIQDTHVVVLEQWIDAWTPTLRPLKNFIIPGGSLVSAHLHMARTIARRAERRAVLVAQQSSLRPQVVQYLNRLSDYLFIAARVANHLLDKEEVIWQASVAHLS